jgi:hypothetical protein
MSTAKLIIVMKQSWVFDFKDKEVPFVGVEVVAVGCVYAAVVIFCKGSY